MPILSGASAVARADDPEGAVGGVVMPVNKLEIVSPFAALTGLVEAVEAVVVIRRKRDWPFENNEEED